MSTIAEKVLKQLTELCGACYVVPPGIEYSTVSKQFYLSAPFNIKEGICLKGVVAHEDTIEAACLSFIRAITGKLLVFNAMDEEKRKEVLFMDMLSLGEIKQCTAFLEEE